MLNKNKKGYILNVINFEFLGFIINNNGGVQKEAEEQQDPMA